MAYFHMIVKWPLTYLLIESLAQRARLASLALNSASSKENDALEAIARGLEFNRKILLEENQKDLNAAEENGLSNPWWTDFA